MPILVKKDSKENDKGSELMNKLCSLLDNKNVLLFAKLLHFVGSISICLLVVSLKYFDLIQVFNLSSISKSNLVLKFVLVSNILPEKIYLIYAQSVLLPKEIIFCSCGQWPSKR